jgi:hypothetical protein
MNTVEKTKVALTSFGDTGALLSKGGALDVAQLNIPFVLSGEWLPGRSGNWITERRLISCPIESLGASQV